MLKSDFMHEINVCYLKAVLLRRHFKHRTSDKDRLIYLLACKLYMAMAKQFEESRQ